MLVGDVKSQGHCWTDGVVSVGRYSGLKINVCGLGYFTDTNCVI